MDDDTGYDNQYENVTTIANTKLEELPTYFETEEDYVWGPLDKPPASPPSPLDLSNIVTNTGSNTGRNSPLPSESQPSSPSKTKNDTPQKKHKQKETPKCEYQDLHYRSTVTFNFENLKSISSTIMFVNIVLLLICWLIIVGWKTTDGVAWASMYDEIHFFLVATILPWFILLLFTLLLICNIHKSIGKGTWYLMCTICVGILAFILFIASVVLVAKLVDHKNDNSLSGDIYCENWKCSAINAGCVFGFLSTVGLVVQTVFHILEFRQTDTSIKFICFRLRQPQENLP